MFINQKKKIRGWKRQIRKIDKWKRRVIDFDIEHFNQYHRDYAKLWIHPFYAIPRRNPPAWYNRFLLEAMLDVHLNWNEKLTDTGEDYYLKLWIYDPHFIHSQVVAAYRNSLHFYDKAFDVGSQEKQFPFYKFDYLREKLERFDWCQHIDCDVFTECELLDNVQRGWMSEKEIEAIKGKAYKVETIHLSDGDTDKTYSVQVGDVWIGTIKK
ncbi:hypothetical protein D3P08_03470 [Paenibacillus nanensis]|uniref:DUF3841 domain-containing protein n=1 Tax=Paenibacillus nanensis TaxID=393251 RepID=A0A3A1VE90_9BACL|nr:hypothetical protein [Paenibacillus nanensis]RIX59228.1 hypothetical protein D3P08_03470 [Paenibacillus nanensis]